MSSVLALLSSRRVPQVAVLALMSFGFAGCSADMQTRLSQNNFTNPFASDTTGAVPAPQRELPQYQRPQYQAPQYQQPQYQRPQYQSSELPPPISTPRSYPSADAGGVSGGGRGVGSYAPPNRPAIEQTGTVAPRSIAAAKGGALGGNGTTIIVGTSDTLEVIARRYNVSSADILKANGYRGPRALQPGQSLVIPHKSAVATAAPVPAAATPGVAGGVHYVNKGDTLASIARRNNVSVGELARANNMSPTAPLKLGAKINLPGAKSAAVAAQPAPAAPVAAAPVQPVATQVAAAAPAPAQKARLASATTTPEAVVPEPATKAAEATGALPSFRWPVRGRVIAGYGAKTNGKANDGINLAVPEGTPVKAAEDGVVAYAGNELKGYGNLVLVRHSNGYVTAYAHASELMVKRGETIKRGQTIAKSGQSGEVGSPQLHFEIRKGSTPVDPQQFLNGG